MAWLEITIDTESKRINQVVTVLTAKGFADLVIEDQEEFETFLEENRAYWDYIDEEPTGRKAGRTTIRPRKWVRRSSFCPTGLPITKRTG